MSRFDGKHDASQRVRLTHVVSAYSRRRIVVKRTVHTIYQWMQCLYGNGQRTFHNFCYKTDKYGLEK
jgi:hypothetical protein